MRELKTRRRGTRHLESRLTWGYVLRHREGNTNRRSLERVGHPRGHGRVTRPRRRSTSSVARTVRSRLLAVANSADGAALRDSSSYPSEIAAAVTVTKHCGVRVPRNKQPALHISSTSHHLITAPHHGNNHHSFNFFKARYLSERTACQPSTQKRRKRAQYSRGYL